MAAEYGGSGRRASRFAKDWRSRHAPDGAAGRRSLSRARSAGTPGGGPPRAPWPRSGSATQSAGGSRQSARALGGPGEARLGQERRQHPAGIVRIVGGEAQLAAGPDHPGELGRRSAGLTIRRLWWRSLGQGSGNRTKARSRLAVGQRLEQQARVVHRGRGHCARPCRLDGAQQLGDAVEERLDADKADLGMAPPPAPPDARRRRSRSRARSPAAASANRRARVERRARVRRRTRPRQQLARAAAGAPGRSFGPWRRPWRTPPRRRRLAAGLIALS